MDPLISWFQPEQHGPALELWSKIWDCCQQSKTLADPSNLTLPLHNQQTTAESSSFVTTPSSSAKDDDSILVNPPDFSAGTPSASDGVITNRSLTSSSDVATLVTLSTHSNGNLVASPIEQHSQPAIGNATLQPPISMPMMHQVSPIPTIVADLVQQAATNLPILLQPTPEFIPLTAPSFNPLLVSRYPSNASVMPTTDQLDPANIFFDPAVQMVLQKDGLNTAATAPVLTTGAINYGTNQHSNSVTSALTRIGMQLPAANNNSNLPATATSTATQELNQECQQNDNGLNCNGSKRKRENKASTYDFNSHRCEYTRQFGGVPWIVPPDKNYSFGLLGLHEEIMDFWNWMKPTNEEQIIRTSAFHRVRDVIIKLWPSAVVDFFGSFRTGLYLPTSDIDVVVIGKWEALPLRTLESALKDSQIADDNTIKVLDKAAVPIVKLTDKLTDIRMDISFNMNNGLKSAALIAEFLNKYPHLTPLVYVLKQFLLQRNLNEVFTGGISSYCLILMAISFLQRHSRQQSVTSATDCNVGVLLIEFFELYGRHFNYARTGIRLTDQGCYVPKEEIQKHMAPGQQPSMLCIEDPLQPGNDIGRSSYGIFRVRQAFEYAFLQLAKLVSFPDRALIKDGHSYLARIIRITDDVVKYRRYLNERFQILFANQSVESMKLEKAKCEEADKRMPASYAAVAATKHRSKKSFSRKKESKFRSHSLTSCASDVSNETDIDICTRSARIRSSTVASSPSFRAVGERRFVSNNSRPRTPSGVINAVSKNITRSSTAVDKRINSPAADDFVVQHVVDLGSSSSSAGDEEGDCSIKNVKSKKFDLPTSDLQQNTQTFVSDKICDSSSTSTGKTVNISQKKQQDTIKRDGQQKARQETDSGQRRNAKVVYQPGPFRGGPVASQVFTSSRRKHSKRDQKSINTSQQQQRQISIASDES